MRLIDLTGQTFGRLIVIERAPDPSGRGKGWWLCRCVCGAERTALGGYLRNGRANSCGTACTLASDRRPWPRDARYLIGEDGSIVGPSGRMIQPFPDDKGYLRFNTYVGGKWNQYAVHVAVCETFWGSRPEGLIVLHGDGNPANASAGNLRWGTYVENEADKLEHGRRMQGEGHHQAKLTEDDVRTIRASAEPATSIARRYPVSPSMVRRIRARSNWQHVS